MIATIPLALPAALTARGDGPNPIDVYVGTRLRLRRTLLGYSQDTVAQTLGISFQQLQKYERGANRISASRLYNFSLVLGVPVQFFYDGFGGVDGAPDTILCGPEEMGQMSRRETLELVRNYYAIQDPTVRQRTYDLVKRLGGTTTT